MQVESCGAFCFGAAFWGPALFAGVLAGAGSALFVRAYVRLAKLGGHPDLHLLALALRVAFCRPFARRVRARSMRRRRAGGAARPARSFSSKNLPGGIGGVLGRAGPVWLLGACFGLLCAHYGVSPRFVGLALACVLLVNLAWIDRGCALLPDALTQPLLWLGLAAAWLEAGISLHAALAGVIAGFVFLYLYAAALRLATGREVIGDGDVKLLAALGAWLGAGWLAWVLAAACAAGLVSAMWRQRTWRPRGDYPFGPFLAWAAVCVLCLGPVVGVKGLG